MIITERFVVLNNPRTGSTFVREVLKQLHGRRRHSPGRLGRLLGRLKLHPDRGFAELLLDTPGRQIPPNQHGGYFQIPPEHRGKEVVSVVRDPFARLLSIYRYGWWKKYPPVDAATIARHLPAFPHLSFREFVELEELSLERRLGSKFRDLQVGRQTVRFIDMFFRDPAAVLSRLNGRYLESDEFADDLPAIRFLQTETLNRGLFEFLRERDYPLHRIEFILENGAVNRSPLTETDLPWTRELIDGVLHRERLLFRMLGNLGFAYVAPSEAAAPMDSDRHGSLEGERAS
jgi:hypothetical protein